MIENLNVRKYFVLIAVGDVKGGLLSVLVVSSLPDQTEC